MQDRTETVEKRLSRDSRTPRGPQSRPAWLRFGVAATTVLVAFGLREALTPALGPTALPFITFLPAVAWVAWFGGLAPAIAAIVLAALVSNWFFVAPLHQLTLHDPATMLAFPIAAGLIVAAVESMHRARRGLGQAHDLLATTLASIGDAVIVTDPTGRVSSLNPEAERLTGWSHAEARGKPLAEVFRIVNETTRATVDNPVDRVLREGRVVELANHTLLIARDGSETPIADSAAPVRDPGGPVEGVVLVFRDIREQRLGDIERGRLASIVETSGDAILSKTLTGTVLTWNAAAERLFGWRADEIVGRPIWMLVPEELRAEEAAVLEALHEGRPSELRETTRLTKDGRRVAVHVNVSPLRAADGQVIGASTIVRDLSEVLAAREALAAKVQQLNEADQRKNEFIATLAHELRNPLAPIKNSIMLLQMKGPQVKELVDARAVIERQVDQIARLLDDLLDINRLVRQKLELRREHVTLDSVLAAAMETARPGIVAQRHRVDLKVPEGVVLDADPVRLSQVFANLLSNAAKYMDPGGSIAVRGRIERDDVVVAVSDEGIGIAAESLPGLFEMFAQVPMSIERAQGGVGIGLSIAKALVEMHGGTIEAHSAGLGRGSEFVVRLPIAVAAPLPRAAAAKSLDRKPALPRRILVADDMHDNADTLALMLGALGHDVHVAYGGEEAVALAEKLRPEVALIDIGMPSVSGYEVATRIRAQDWGRGIYLIAQTGWGQEADRRKAEEAGFDRHMRKPIDGAALVVVLSNLPTVG